MCGWVRAAPTWESHLSSSWLQKIARGLAEAHLTLDSFVSHLLVLRCAWRADHVLGHIYKEIWAIQWAPYILSTTIYVFIKKKTELWWHHCDHCLDYFLTPLCGEFCYKQRIAPEVLPACCLLHTCQPLADILTAQDWSQSRWDGARAVGWVDAQSGGLWGTH